MSRTPHPLLGALTIGIAGAVLGSLAAWALGPAWATWIAALVSAIALAFAVSLLIIARRVHRELMARVAAQYAREEQAARDFAMLADLDDSMDRTPRAELRRH